MHAKTTFRVEQCSAAKGHSCPARVVRTGVLEKREAKQNAGKSGFRYGDQGVKMGFWVRKGKICGLLRGIHRWVKIFCGANGLGDNGEIRSGGWLRYVGRFLG